MDASIQLVLIFANTKYWNHSDAIDAIRNAFPNAILFGCSTSGEIADTRVFDNSLTCVAVHFEHSHVRTAAIKLKEADSDFNAGQKLFSQLNADDLRHIFVLSDGLNVNGSELVRGLTTSLPPSVRVTGGLAGDEIQFKKTLVFNGNTALSRSVVALGLYGERLKIGYGCVGGWDQFGPERFITRSSGNVLYELDDKPALPLYKNYLGHHADGLPGTGLLFPLRIRAPRDEESVVRSILGIDEKAGSLIFGGDVPTGHLARMMKANFERLIDGAADAALHSSNTLSGKVPELAILISSIGRKMVLKQRVEDEIEAVRDVFGVRPVLTGFYSYGEISPGQNGLPYQLHNQTMTITTITEP